MSRKVMVLCLAVFFVCIGKVASAEERPSNRTVSERPIYQVDFSWWVPPESFKVSSDSKNIGHVAKVGNKWFVVVDGNEGKRYDATGKGSLVFGPDGNYVAYVATDGYKQFVVVDGIEGKEYRRILYVPRFDSPDSLHYIAIKAVEDNSIYLVEERIN